MEDMVNLILKESFVKHVIFLKIKSTLIIFDRSAKQRPFIIIKENSVWRCSEESAICHLKTALFSISHIVLGIRRDLTGIIKCSDSDEEIYISGTPAELIHCLKDIIQTNVVEKLKYSNIYHREFNMNTEEVD